MKNLLIVFAALLAIAVNVSAEDRILKQPALVIEKAKTYSLEKGTRLVVLDKLVMKEGSTLKIPTGVNDIKFEIGELVAGKNTTIDSSTKSNGPNGNNGNNASGQPGYCQKGHDGGDAGNGKDGGSAVPVVKIKTGIRAIGGLTLRGNGGNGGNGGHGGSGAIGGGYKCSHTRGCSAGRGGTGGYGGNGGNGGDATLFVVKWWPASGVTIPHSPTGTPVNLTIVAKGGKKGARGNGGSGGPSHHGHDCGTWEPSVGGGPAGKPGNPGKPGIAGDSPSPKFIHLKESPYEI